MCTSEKPIDRARYKMMRLKHRMADTMLNATDYSFYLELYQLAKLQYRKMKQTG